jgi:hypothetical protein
MTENVGNPYFGKQNMKVCREACEPMTEERIKHLNELHHVSSSVPIGHKKNRKYKL